MGTVKNLGAMGKWAPVNLNSWWFYSAVFDIFFVEQVIQVNTCILREKK